MARIRTIKPEFPQSESIGKLSRDARLLFIQLWTVVDDAGRFRAASRLLASLLYPYDNDAINLMDGWLEELESNQHIRRYEVEGCAYLEICNWLKHQKIDRPSPSRLPSPPESSRNIASVPRSLDADLVPSTCTSTPDAREDSRVPNDSEAIIFEVAKSYPKLSHLRDVSELSHAQAEAIIDALAKDGKDAVLSGTRAFVSTLDSPKFAPDPVRFFSEYRYRPLSSPDTSAMKPTPPELQFGYAEKMRRMGRNQ